VWRPGELLNQPIRARSAGESSCELLSMVFRLEAQHESPLIEGLPRRILIRHGAPILGDLLELVRRFVTSEAEQSQAGYAIVSNRLAELLFMQIVRLQMLTAPAETSGMLRGLSNQAIARCLAAMHAKPEANWTVAEMAAVCGLSRTVFAQRFHGLVGRPPLQYLTRLRMERAAERLSQGARVKVVAGEAGYATGYAFSEAFKRHFGCLPSRYRSGRIAV
jgi:AraC-like DNA-binding protein